jgi:hypothetical protein
MTTLALVLASCDQAGERVLTPAAPNASVVSKEKYGFQLVEGVIPSDVTSLQVTQVIGPLGGTLSLAGHSLTVPQGAVSEPTLFVMTLGTRGYVEVDLKATREILGTVVDIGSHGFLNGRTVTLSLTYAWATNVDNPARLSIVRELSGGELQGLKSKVDKRAKQVSTELEHLSSYAVAM